VVWAIFTARIVEGIMPAQLTYPGVYVEEIPSGVHTITGVPTSIAAFVGRTARGPENKATTITSYADFERQFGGLDVNSPVSFAVRDFFLNGGSQAIIVRLTSSNAAKANLPIGTVNSQTVATLEAASPGSWGQSLRGQIGFDVSAIRAAKLDAEPWKMFSLTLQEAIPGGAVETYQNLSTEPDSPRRVDVVLKNQSALAVWKGWTNDTATALNPQLQAVYDKYADVADKEKALATAAAADRAKAQQDLDAARKALVPVSTDPASAAQEALAAAQGVLRKGSINPALLAVGSGLTVAALQSEVAAQGKALANATTPKAGTASDGDALTYPDYFPNGGLANKTGLYALEDADIFNLLCLPCTDDTTYLTLLADAVTYCEQRRAMLIVDPPTSGTWKDANAAKAGFTDTSVTAFPGIRSRNAALYFPRVEYPNPLKDMQVEEFPPCGVVAGLYAKTDTNRGVWKAPAGIENPLVAVQSLAVTLTDAENGLLNPLGINCLRSFPVAGRVAWGARTLRGADQLADDYKYVPVRRLALFIEESLYRGTQWAVFEPNDEPLWAQLRLNVGAFMHDLFRRGAFQGQTPQQAYLVKCDKETTTQTDINLGVVNVVVAFAPLKPAEFVVLKIQQLTGQIDT
jgi:phage tail sheath protein FI